MSKQTAVLTSTGSRTAIPSGRRLTIDPQLRSAESAVLSPNHVTCSEGFLYLGPNGDGTFDVQNITDAAQDLAWTATWIHSINFDHALAPQTGLGPNGADPSANPAVTISGGGGGSYDDTLFLPRYGKPAPATTTQEALDANKKDIRTLLFRPGLPPSTPPAPDSFDTWADLYAAYQTIAGAVKIVFQPDPANPSALTIPAGTWDFGYKDTFCGIGCSLGFPTQVFLADGCLLRNIYHFSDSVFLVGQTTSAPQLEWDELGASTLQEIVTFVDLSGIGNEGSAPMIVWAKDAAVDGILLLGFGIASRIERRTSPVVDIQPGPGATQSEVFVYALEATTIDDDVFTGSGNVVLRYFVQSNSANASVIQPGFSGANVLESPQGYINFAPSKVRYSLNPPPVSGSYNAESGEVVRCEPDGSLTPINVELPPSSENPCAMISVKRNNADTATAINVNAQPGDDIDGSASYVLSTEGRDCVTLASDGSRWLVLNSYPSVSSGGVFPSFPSSPQVSSAAGSQPLLEYFLDGDYLNTGSLGAAADMTPLAPNPGIFTGSTRSENKLAAAALFPGAGGIFSGGRTPDLAALNINGPCTLFLCVQGVSYSTQWLNAQTFSLAWIGRTGFPNETLFGLYAYGPTSTLVFYTFDVGPILLDTSALVQAGQPYNLVATRSASDGLNQQIRVYINGREVLNQLALAQTTTPGSNFFDLGNAHSVNNMGQAVYDYAALWDAELTAPQVQAVNALFPIR